MGFDQEKRGNGPEGLAQSAAVLLDPRLVEVWRFLWSSHAAEGADGEPAGPVPNPDSIGPLLRMAYLQGYDDALTEEDPGALYRELGVRRAVTPIPRPARRPRRGAARRGSSDT